MLTPAERPLVASLTDVAEAVVVTRSDLVAPGPIIIGASPAFLALTGYRRDELIGRSPRLLQGPLTDRAAVHALRESCLRG